MYQVYILYSPTLDVYYKVTTQKIEKRIKEHQDGKSRYTSQARDWELKYQREYCSKREVLIEEKWLKRLNRASIVRICIFFLNQVNTFFSRAPLHIRLIGHQSRLLYDRESKLKFCSCHLH